MANLTPQVNTGQNYNSAIAGGLSNVSPTGNVKSYFQPSTPNFLNSSPSNSNVAHALLGGGQLVASGQNMPSPTPSGGIAISQDIAKNYNSPTTTRGGDLNSYLINKSSTPNGGQLSTDGNGNVIGHTPAAQYTINTDGSNDSSSLGARTSMGNLMQTHNQLSDYVNAVSQANGYNPQYLGALNQQYGAQQQGAALGYNQAQYGFTGAGLGVQSAQINSNLYTGNNLPGDTMAYAQGATAKAQAQNTLQQATNTYANAGNTLQQAQNSIQQLGANQALNTAQLARTGNIAGAQAQLQYSPGAVAAQNAQAQYNQLSQAYAGITPPPFNPNEDPQAQLQNLHALISQSPAYKSGFQSTYATPAGGTGIYNKLDTGLMTHNPDGTISLVNDGAAITGAADRSAATALSGNINSLVPAFNAANKDFGYITNFMQQAGINESNVPAINQVANYAKAKGLDAGVIAQFKAGIASLRTNYANLLGSRGETPTQAGADASQLVPDDITPAAMTKVQDALNTNGQNVINSSQQQLQGILSKYGANANPTNLGGGSTPSWPGWNP